VSAHAEVCRGTCPLWSLGHSPREHEEQCERLGQRPDSWVCDGRTHPCEVCGFPAASGHFHLCPRWPAESLKLGAK
jgi:ribosomal protein L37E